MRIYNKVLPYLLVAAGFVCTGCEPDYSDVIVSKKDNKVRNKLQRFKNR